MSLIRRDDRWGLDPFQEIVRLEDDMRKLFSNVFGSRDIAQMERVYSPLVDFIENDNQFLVEADIPGFKKEEITIDVASDAIEITAEHKEEKEQKTEGKYIRRERCAYKFYRKLPLPSPVNTDDIKSSFKDGTLKLELPKTPGTGKKRITF